MRNHRPFRTLLAVATLALAGGASAEERPLAELPYTPGLDLASMDPSVAPCVDFYAYACGGWRKQNPIPPDQAGWSVYAKLSAQNRQFLWGLLEEAARKPDAERTSDERKVGDYFASCMDEGAVERAGAGPMGADLAAIDRLSSKAELGRLLGRLHLVADGGMLFDFGAEQSFENSDEVVAWVGAGGLGLPDRDQYLARTRDAARTRRAYLAHLARMLELSGLDPPAALAGARSVMEIETALARASLPRAERRDPVKIWHHTPREALARLAPSFRWRDYFEASGVPPVAWLNVSEPAFLAALDREIARRPLAEWKAYLRWHLVRSESPYLSLPFQGEHFAFYQARLRGVKEMEPRWKRCVEWVDRDLGEVLGKLFVARVFTAKVKAEAQRMVELVEAAMASRIDGLDWMGPETKKAAREKLAAVRNKIGYPERWRDYSRLEVARDDFAGNVRRASVFEEERQRAKIGKPVDRAEWTATPPTVNAFYNPSMNDLNFPAGVLLPPLWDPRIDLAPGYGNTGGTVGHELIHGFDDEGRQFDAKGNLRDWWTRADGREFKKRAQCIVDQYAGYTVVDDVKVNSKLTLGEDLADLAGLELAWQAWKAATAGERLEPIDGLTPDQRFFVGYAQWACANERPEDERLRALTDPHSPPRWRVNGLVVNMGEFAKAFGCRAGQPMVRERACRVW